MVRLVECCSHGGVCGDTQISNFLFGDGFAVAEGELWQARRRAVAPSLHKDYLDAMVRPSVY